RRPPPFGEAEHDDTGEARDRERPPERGVALSLDLAFGRTLALEAEAGDDVSPDTRRRRHRRHALAQHRDAPLPIGQRRRDGPVAARDRDEAPAYTGRRGSEREFGGEPIEPIVAIGARKIHGA